MTLEIKNKNSIIYDKTWFDVVFDSSEKKAYELLMDLLHKDNIDRKIFNDESLINEILELWLEKNNLIEDILYLDNLLEQKHKGLYNQVSQYTKWYIIDYFLFKRDKEKIKKHLNYFIKNPVETINELIVIFQKLQFYWYVDLAVELSKKVYNLIIDSDKLIWEPEENFVETMYIDLLNKIYIDINSWKNINWDNFRKEVSKIDYFVHDSKDKDFELLKDSFLNKEIIINDKDWFSTNTTKIMYFFTKYMYDKNKTPFYFSRKNLVNIYSFLSSIHKKKSKTLKGFFTFNYNQLDENIWKKFWIFTWEDSIVNCFVLLWGIPYFYEYLLQIEIISNKEYEIIIKYVNKLKTVIKNASGNQLWRYSFLENLWELWGNSEEYKDFLETINIKTSLSDEVKKEDDSFFDEFDEEECGLEFCTCGCKNEDNYSENSTKNKAMLKKKEKIDKKGKQQKNKSKD